MNSQMQAEPSGNDQPKPYVLRHQLRLGFAAGRRVGTSDTQTFKPQCFEGGGMHGFWGVRLKPTKAPWKPYSDD
jgi:hypothetical protein